MKQKTDKVKTTEYNKQTEKQLQNMRNSTMLQLRPREKLFKLNFSSQKNGCSNRVHKGKFK